MQMFTRSQVPTLAATYSITFVRTGGGRGCPSGGIAGSATQGATVGGSTTNDRTHSDPSHRAPAGIWLDEEQLPSQPAGGSNEVTVDEEIS